MHFQLKTTTNGHTIDNTKKVDRCDQIYFSKICEYCQYTKTIDFIQMNVKSYFLLVLIRFLENKDKQMPSKAVRLLNSSFIELDIYLTVINKFINILAIILQKFICIY